MPIVDLLPVGDGAPLQWPPVPAGTPHYLRVLDFDGPDDESGYLSGGLLNNVSMFHTMTAPDLGGRAPGAVEWVGVFARIRRSGTQQTPFDFFGPIIGAGPTAENVDSLLSGNNAWTDFDPEFLLNWRFTVNPETGLPWTWSEALATPVGVKDLTSGTHVLRCTQLRKRVMVALSEPAVGAGSVRWMRR